MVRASGQERVSAGVALAARAENIIDQDNTTAIQIPRLEPSDVRGCSLLVTHVFVT